MAVRKRDLKSRSPNLWWRRKLLVTGGVVYLLAGLLPVGALDPTKPLHQYNCRSWGYANGLPVNSVQAIAQTRDGCLWLGTRRGLMSFDGVEFTIVGTPPASELRTTRVQALWPSGRGGIWFGFRRSAYGFRSADGAWRLGRDPQVGMGWDVPCILEASDGTLWVGGERAAKGPADTLQLERLFPVESDAPIVISLLEDSKGRVWVGTAQHGLFCWQDGKLTEVPDPQLKSRIIHALAEDRAGQLWLGTQAGLLCYDAQLQNNTDALPEYEVRCLLTDRHGVLWVGTTGHGLARVRNGLFEMLTTQDGLTDNTISALAEDAEGNLWMGTPEGLNQLTDIKFPTYAVKDGLPIQSALSVSLSPRGGVWLGTDVGAVYWNGSESQVYSTNQGLHIAYVKRVLEATNGDVFVISGRNMIEVLSGGTVVARHATPGMPVAMVEDTEGVVVSVAGGLFRVSRDRLWPYPFPNDRKPTFHWIMNLANGREGAIWVASVNGIFRIKDGEFQQWTQADGLADFNTRWVHEETDGTVWIGLATGMARMKDGRIHNFRQADGLHDGNLYSITPDERGWLWVDSLSGLFRLKKRNVEDFISGKVSRLECFAYDSPEAVRPGDKSSQETTACRTSDSRIWFPGPKGVVVVDPAQVPLNQIAPPVRIRHVRAKGVELDRSKPILLPPGQRDLEFSYTAFSFTSPRGVRFRYRLEGLDADWLEAGERRLAYYANLRPGSYIFRVTACNADGVWNRTGDSVAFRLRPHFYQTVWFTALGVLAVLGGLSGLYLWRFRHLRRKQQQLQEARDILENSVAERTAELARSNAFLVSEIEERKRMQQEVERVHEALVAASRHAGQAEVASSVLHNVGNVLNSVNVSAGLLSERVRKLRVKNLARAVELIEEHSQDLGQFLATDPKGRQLPQYLRELSRYLAIEQEQLLTELRGLSENVDHIKEIVAMQQAYAKVAGLLERVTLADLVESALKMQADSLSRRSVQVVREFEDVPPVTTDRHKVLQILVNLLSNARHACEQGSAPQKQITLRIRRGPGDVALIEVADNGVGIASDSLTRIFSHGFTTRKGGHGFGLHSAALAASELGGSLQAASEGLGKGATFTLTLPCIPPAGKT